MTSSRYVYSTVRVVPNPASGEFANLAAIAGSDETGEWSIRALGDQSRVVRFCGASALSAAHDFLSHTGERFAWHEMLIESDGDLDEAKLDGEVSEAWLARTAASNRETVQLTEPRPVLAESVDHVFDLLIPRVLVEPERRETHGITKWRALSDLHKRYAANGLGKYVERKRILSANGFEYAIDFTVSDYRRAVQLSQAWSFQIADVSPLRRDVKAWGWTLRELRDRGGAGGAIRLDGKSVPVAYDVPAHVLVVPPLSTDQRGVDSFGEANHLFADLGVHVHELDSDLSVITDEARDLLGVDAVAT